MNEPGGIPGGPWDASLPGPVVFLLVACGAFLVWVAVELIRDVKNKRR